MKNNSVTYYNNSVFKQPLAKYSPVLRPVIGLRDIDKVKWVPGDPERLWNGMDKFGSGKEIAWIGNSECAALMGFNFYTTVVTGNDNNRIFGVRRPSVYEEQVVKLFVSDTWVLSERHSLNGVITPLNLPISFDESCLSFSLGGVTAGFYALNKYSFGRCGIDFNFNVQPDWAGRSNGIPYFVGSMNDNSLLLFNNNFSLVFDRYNN